MRRWFKHGFANVAAITLLCGSGAASSAAQTQAVAGSTELPGPLRRQLVQRYFEAHDTENGGLKREQKTLDRDSTEYAMFRARVGDETAAERAQHTLTAALALQDPVTGGFYSYSTGGDWHHPHDEKPLRVQADNLRTYALAQLQWPDSRYLKAAQHIRDYLRDYLASPQSVVQENGRIIEALATFYRADRSPAVLDAALRATRWVLANRALPDGGFRHAARDSGGPFLDDTLAMGSAYLVLYHVTAERDWLQQATQAGQFIVMRFRNPVAGFNTSVAVASPQLEENIRATRFLNLLAHYTGNPDFLRQAQHGMRYLSRPEVVKAALGETGILLADDELGRDPLHVTVVGSKDDRAAQSLFAAALSLPGAYQRIEWWDRREGPLPHADVEYPALPKSAAFVCADKHCSSPAFEAERLRQLLQDSGKQD